MMNKEMMGLFTDSEVEEAQALNEVKFESETDNAVAGDAWSAFPFFAAGSATAAGAFV